MKFSALALIIGIVTLLLVASTQSRPATAATTPCPQTGTFNVYVLAKGFQPSLPYNSDSTKTYAPPSSTIKTLTLTVPPPATSPSAMAADLNQAFAIAPPFFLTQLCRLDGIFINANDCNPPFDTANDVCSGLSPGQITDDSWGYREGPWQFAPGAPPGHYGRYIAISAGPWSAKSIHAPTYGTYQLALLQQLLPWADTTAPTFTANSTADTSAMSVLAAIAHEFGHVLWYDTFRPTPGGSYDFETFCRGTFFGKSWRSVDPPPLWREFGDIQNEHIHFDTNIADIALAINRHSINPNHAGDLLHEIYKRGAHWASLFGAFSPDEDFIETHVLYVMTEATPALTSLQITITGATGGTCSKETYGVCKDDIPGDLAGDFKPELMRKKTCIAQLVNP